MLYFIAIGRTFNTSEDDGYAPRSYTEAVKLADHLIAIEKARDWEFHFNPRTPNMWGGELTKRGQTKTIMVIPTSEAEYMEDEPNAQ